MKRCCMSVTVVDITMQAEFVLKRVIWCNRFLYL
jgi:hypothetical protein